MMFYCPVCGRRRFVHQPQFWPYRFDGEMFCIENCWICDSTRKMMERKGFRMARMKKDGTPAKKPGPKAKKVEVPEPISGGPWEKTETPETVVPIEEIDKIVPPKPLVYDGYTVRCIEGPMGKFYYDKGYDRLDWTTPEGEKVSFSPSAWKVFATEELPKVMAILGV